MGPLREGKALGRERFNLDRLTVVVDVLAICVRGQLLAVDSDLVLNALGLFNSDVRRLLTGCRVVRRSTRRRVVLGRSNWRYRGSVLLSHRDSDVNLVGGTIRVSHLNRNSDLVTRGSILRDGNGDFTGVLINGHTIWSTFTRGERGAIRSSSRVAVLVLEGRLVDLDVLTRLTRTAVVHRIELFVLLGVRSIRLLNSDGYVNVVLRTIRVSHLNRNSDLVTRLNVLRNGNSDLTSVRINLHTIRSILTRLESRAIRSSSRVTVLVLKLRSRNSYILTRLTRTILITRLKGLIVLCSRCIQVKLRRNLARYRISPLSRGPSNLYQGLILAFNLLICRPGDHTGRSVDLQAQLLSSGRIYELESCTFRHLLFGISIRVVEGRLYFKILFLGSPLGLVVVNNGRVCQEGVGQKKGARWLTRSIGSEYLRRVHSRLGETVRNGEVAGLQLTELVSGNGTDFTSGFTVGKPLNSVLLVGNQTSGLRLGSITRSCNSRRVIVVEHVVDRARSQQGEVLDRNIR